MMLNILFLIFLLPLYPSLLLGALPTPESLTLSQIVEKAQKNAKLLQSEKAQVTAEENRLEHAGLLPNPSIALTGGKIDSVGVTGPIFEATLYQTIPFPGKIGAKEDVGRAQLQLSQNQFEDQSLQWQHRVVLLTYRYAVIGQLVKHVTERKVKHP